MSTDSVQCYDFSIELRSGRGFAQKPDATVLGLDTESRIVGGFLLWDFKNKILPEAIFKPISNLDEKILVVIGAMQFAALSGAASML